MLVKSPKLKSRSDILINACNSLLIIRLGDRITPNVGFTLRGNLAVFTHSAIG